MDGAHKFYNVSERHLNFDMVFNRICSFIEKDPEIYIDYPLGQTHKRIKRIRGLLQQSIFIVLEKVPGAVYTIDQ